MLSCFISCPLNSEAGERSLGAAPPVQKCSTDHPTPKACPRFLCELSEPQFAGQQNGDRNLRSVTQEGPRREHEKPPHATLPSGVLTSPASAVLSGAVHLAWISESLQETGQRQSREGLLEGGQPSPAPPGAWSSAGRGPTGTLSGKCSGLVPWLPGEGVQVSPWPQPPDMHTPWYNRSFLPVCLPCCMGHLDPSKGPSFWRKVTPLSWHVPP